PAAFISSLKAVISSLLNCRYSISHLSMFLGFGSAISYARNFSCYVAASAGFAICWHLPPVFFFICIAHDKLK
ncbi:MAG: hypothetical protein ACRDBT_11370, partial [Aeromonas sp.]